MERVNTWFEIKEKRRILAAGSQLGLRAHSGFGRGNQTGFAVAVFISVIVPFYYRGALIQGDPRIGQKPFYAFADKSGTKRS